MITAAILILFNTLWALPTLLFSISSQASFDISQFEVHSLPESPSLPLSWAGRLPIPDTEEGNSIFFWLFQAQNLTYDDDLIIWFNGGPGCSSLIGLTTGNGPVSFDGNSTRLIPNPYSWSNLGHVLYVDQPAGTGFSTASDPYPVRDNDRVTLDFYKWLQNFFAHFPHMRSKRVYLIGESYAGIYIPYFASEIMENQKKYPINLRSIALGDGTLGNPAALTTVTMGKFLHSQQTLLQMPDEILSAFAQADETCGFTTILQQAEQYPPEGNIVIPGNPENLNYRRRFQQQQQQQQRRRRNLQNVMNETCNIHPTTPDTVSSSILNSPCYGTCATFSTAMNYMTALSASATNTNTNTGTGKRCFDVYDISNDCDTIDPLDLLATYFSRADVQTALNIPPSSLPDSSSSTTTTTTPFAPCNGTILDTLLTAAPPTPPAYSILPALVTAHNVTVHVYAGEYDMLLNHFGAELCLQNMTWRGAQGFARKPHRVFYADDAAPAVHACNGSEAVDAEEPCREEAMGAEAGVWASERGVSYHFFRGAGHTVFMKKPREMFAYVRDVVVVVADGDS
ncbi:putative serine carboxypeptidase [Aspergillus clavatus NRRL 1]|uniref:Carboxypeptidase n=1 Tax=Aspergillus clavatus (strain ATCC 1007 / CBS 513.65 / DSM 816 / NCTC 3887 / NRRL 1 / QM 1276 / 107) TaxID=344612 RepID=A1CH38_ASPCL|nr:serine carboxypeptidase, putative [Aspergillus clavatus NRRL 1]EAW10193.1 serine carboxypeptidase, putative [Aspergillus clavatus NRRL 1]